MAKRYAFINTETQGVLEACFQNMTPVFTLPKTTQEQRYSLICHNAACTHFMPQSFETSTLIYTQVTANELGNGHERCRISLDVVLCSYCMYVRWKWNNTYIFSCIINLNIIYLLKNTIYFYCIPLGNGHSWARVSSHDSQNMAISTGATSKLNHSFSRIHHSLSSM